MIKIAGNINCMRYVLACLLIVFSDSTVCAQAGRSVVEADMRPFYHGVASGDPTDSSVMIWTRVTPDNGNPDGIKVYWQVARDTSFQQVVNYGTATAIPQNDYCVKVDVCGLPPGSFYYYMFNALGQNSITGRTKTAPAPFANNDSVRFAVVSCADYENGYFNAYESISNKNNVDAVVHLGDYIYEYETGGISINNPGRSYEPLTEIISLADYRIRHSHYKLDPQLRRIHQLFPFVTVWDDHETCNDAYRDGGDNHQSNEGPYSVRKWNATSAYFTWMPLRKPDPLDTIRIFRKLRYGKLLDLIMLDTRLYDRDLQNLGGANDPTRKLMGPVEMNWFLQQLSDTSTRWKIIGNQVMFAPLRVFGQPINADQWDGYNFERTQIQNHILNNNIKDVVVLTGDIHTSWCNDVPGANYNSNTGAGSICVEFVGTSVTSVNSPLPVGVGIIQSQNSHMKYIDLDHHGYYTLDVRKGKAQADYTYVETDQLGSADDEAASYAVNDNERHLSPGTPIFNYPEITAPKPSLDPNQTISFTKITDRYLSINENESGTVNIIPSLNIWPSVSMSVADAANHGFTLSLNGKDVVYAPANDYNGYDTVAFAICSNTSPAVCDTVYLYVTINSVQSRDTFVVNLSNDTLFNSCFSFDDLSAIGVVNHSVVAHGLFIISDTCFSYSPDTSFCGIETITFTTCNNSSECDTIVFVLKVNSPLYASDLLITLNKNSNTIYCPYFDDLICPAQGLNILKAPTHGTYQISGDTCLRYFPYFNFTGTDTLKLTGCDTCGINHCDTLNIILNVVDPSSVKQQENLIVFGVYPNPVDEMLFVQYYLNTASLVVFEIFDFSGKLISADSYSHEHTGLLYARIKASNLSAGIYTFKMTSGSNVYSKIILKN